MQRKGGGESGGKWESRERVGRGGGERRELTSTTHGWVPSDAGSVRACASHSAWAEAGRRGERRRGKREVHVRREREG